MNLSDLIAEFSLVYPRDAHGRFGQSRSLEIITKELPDALKQQSRIDNRYKVYGSAGNGNWAEIPWVAVLDKDITASTQKGYYIVFLFSKDLKKIYLCLSLGWTQFEEEYGIKQGRLQINAVCRHYAELLGGGSGSFISGDIDLQAAHNLGKGYEVGSILFKVYRTNLMNDENINNDVQELLKHYDTLKNIVGDSILNVDIDAEKYDTAVQTFKKDIAQSTFKPISDESIASLMEKAKDEPPQIRERLIRQIARNRKYADYIKQKADYICQICGKRPFLKANGQPYAEADHVKPLGNKGEDSPKNMRCLCAQCHAVITYGSEVEIERILS